MVLSSNGLPLGGSNLALGKGVRPMIDVAYINLLFVYTLVLIGIVTLFSRKDK